MKKKILSLVVSLAMAFSLMGVMPAMEVGATEHSINFNLSFTLTGNGATDMINVAKAQIGRNGGTLGYTEEWCADFISDCAFYSNQSSAIPANGSCYSMMTALNKSGCDPFSPSSAQPGDLLFYSSSSFPNGGAHVELVYANNGGVLSTIGGNCGNSNNSLSLVKDHKNQNGQPTVYKAFRPNYNSNPIRDLEIDTSWNPYLPMKAYTLKAETTYVYNIDCSTLSGGEIWADDECTITRVYTNGWVQVQYPTTSGSKTAYTPMSTFFIGTSLQSSTATQYINTYKRSDRSQLFGNIDSEDICFITGTSGDSVQVLYPIPGGYKLGWTESSAWQDVHPIIRHRISDTEMGEASSVNETGKWCYLCYDMLDKNTSQHLNSVTNKYYDYYVTLEMYSPDGSLFHSYTYTNSDNNWISIKPDIAGTYKYVIKLTGRFNKTIEREFEVVNHSHSYGEWTVTKSPTCSSEGTKTRKCSLCGAIETAAIPKKEHTFNNSISYADGKYTYRCNYCNYTYTEEADAPLEVNFKCDKVVAAPGDTISLNLYADTKGKKFNIFEIRANYDENSLELIDMKATSSLSNIILNPQKGVSLFSSISGAQNNPAVPLITYTFKVSESAKPGTYDLVLTGTNDNPNVLFCIIDSNDNIISNKLGTIYLLNSITVECSHKYTSKVIEPTCTEQGYTLHTCSICGDSYKDTYKNAGHRFTQWIISKDATCSEDGMQTRKCSVCGKIEEETIPANGHLYNCLTKYPTYTEKGYDLHFCVNCDDYYTDNFVEKEQGDMDDDNTIRVSDIVILQKYLTGKHVLTEEQSIGADLNKDNKINVFDMIILKRKIIDS